MNPAPAGRATVLHADLDAFYASVEQRDDPRLRGRPVAVGGGVVLAASYEAKRRGVRTAMSARQARSLCPGLVVVRPRFDAYTAASRAVFAIFADTTPRVQGVSIDEAFLDVHGLHRIDAPPVEIGARLRRRVRAEVGLTITVGVARTPFLAKVASRVAKPDGLLLVEPERERAFLHPLPLEVLWGVGEVTARRLHAYGLTTAGDVAALPREVLVAALGPAMGRHLHAVVHGRTPERVQTGRRRSSVGAQRALGPGPHRPEQVHAALLGLVDRVARRLRGAHRTARTVVLRLRFADYTRATRSRTLPHATASGDLLAATAAALLAEAAPLVRERGITLVGVALTGLEADTWVQPQLDLDGPDRSGLDAAVDAVAEQFGTGALVRGTLLRTGSGLEVPRLPD
ncbi:DNA polymerase IV [Cellulomonas triticagri]|uniref:DNA polymerase IV n=1 Tax=Cellulomonas triticagri TaxID=2483352 RepID=A0A3M2JB25_9CELL|nr:DNA polymerase IV [Cellulomonas triticagri]RMI08713.1 DNA polymerase IV [Cellulomonas triticagri]